MVAGKFQKLMVASCDCREAPWEPTKSVQKREVTITIASLSEEVSFCLYT